jgi:hypothetical protein
MSENHDCRQRRCPRLGDVINFSYCRSGGEEGRPCFKVFDCWWESFDVVGYFRHALSAEDFGQLSSSPAPNKIASLVDLIDQARRRS